MQSEQQQKVIESPHARVSVQASPGSGKTHTLVRRILHFVKSGVNAQNVLALSFSNDAVSELRRRLDVLGAAQKDSELAARLKRVQIQTVHAFALKVVAKRNKELKVLSVGDANQLFDLAVDATISDTRNKSLWPRVSSALRKKRMVLLRELRRNRQFMAALDFAQAAQVTASSAVTNGQFERLVRYRYVANAIARRYSTAKREANVVDFGDMLATATTLFEVEPTLNSFTHVLVDEYQDCSPAQAQLMKALAERCCCHVTVFGDGHQAIYGFAGSHYTPFSGLVESVLNLPLIESHRLTRQTAALASAIANSGDRNVIVAHRDGLAPRLIRSADLTEQTKAVAPDIRRLLERGAAPSTIAVLARAHATLKPVEQALLAVGTQSYRMGTHRDSTHVLRVLRLVRLIERSETHDAVLDLRSFKKLLQPFNSELDDKVWTDLLNRLRKVVRIRALEGRYSRCADIYLLALGGVRKNTAVQHEINRWTPLCRGRSSAADVRNFVRSTERSANVVTGTMHASKGREWKHVFVVGLADGQLPLYFSHNDAHMLAEERRLLYVAITRARVSVRLYYAPVTHSLSRQRFETLSRFLLEPSVKRTLSQSQVAH